LASLAQAIRNWVVQADRQEGRREEKDDGLSTTEREELARLRRENKQLRVKRDILVIPTAFNSDLWRWSVTGKITGRS